jgi:hypothetical protein
VSEGERGRTACEHAVAFIAPIFCSWAASFTCSAPARRCKVSAWPCAAAAASITRAAPWLRLLLAGAICGWLA